MKTVQQERKWPTGDLSVYPASALALFLSQQNGPLIASEQTDAYQGTSRVPILHLIRQLHLQDRVYPAELEPALQ
jgi:hypothetical protein